MAESYEGWAILELMGHRRLGGRVSQVEQYGVPMLRIDVPGAKPGDDTPEEREVYETILGTISPKETDENGTAKNQL